MAEHNVSALLRSAWKVIPHFQSGDIKRTINFYSNVLGFGCEPAEEYLMCSVHVGKKADANIYIFQNSSGQEVSPSATMIALGKTQLDGYYNYLSNRSDVEMVKPIDNMPWGFRQFEIKDPDGNRIQFFAFIEGGNPGDEIS